MGRTSRRPNRSTWQRLSLPERQRKPSLVTRKIPTQELLKGLNLSTLVPFRNITNNHFRNNADLGKGVPRHHVTMRPVNSSFFFCANLPCAQIHGKSRAPSCS